MGKFLALLARKKNKLERLIKVFAVFVLYFWGHVHWQIIVSHLVQKISCGHLF